MKKFICCLFVLMIICSGCSEKAEDHYEQALKYIEENQIDKAIEELNEAIKADPENKDLYLKRASCYMMTDQDGVITIDVEKARADYEKVLQIDPDNEEAIVGIYNVKLFKNSYEEAVQFLNDAVSGKDVSDEIKNTLANAKEGNISDMLGRKRVERAYYHGELVRTSYFDYGEDGRISKVRSFNGNNESIGDVEVTYDNAGNRLTWVTVFDTGEVLRTENKYDDQNRMIFYETYHMDGTLYEKANLEYDQKGNLVKETTERNNRTETETREYDDKNQLLSTHNYNDNNELEYYRTYEYENEKVAKVNYYDGDGTYTGYLVHKYDENGKYLGYARYDGNGTLEYEQVSGN